jgi:hypothetical protein
MRTYRYTNLDGRKKSLIVKPTETTNDFYVEIWNLDTGDFCGYGYKTAEQITEFLAQYDVKF